MNAIYLDNNATTPMLPAAWEAMQPFFFDRPGNPASSHRFGRQARQALEDAREQIAELLDAHPEEVLFTSGATEANNLAVLGLTAGAAAGSLVTSALEHPCVVEPMGRLAERGFVLKHLPVSQLGQIDERATVFPDDVRLAAVMLANHETGALQPIEALVQQLAGKAPFHCDAAAAAGKLPISLDRKSVV